MSPRLKNVLTSLLLALSLSLSAVASSARAESEALVRLLDSAVGHFILRGTEGGTAIATRVLGRELSASTNELTELLTRLNGPEYYKVSWKLESGMRRVEARFKQRFPESGELFTARGMRALSAEQEAFLRELAAAELAIDIRFFPAASGAGYTSARDTFVRALEMRPGSGPILRYPVGVDPMVHPGSHIQFGFESEYALKESEKLLSVYGPKPESGITATRWRNMAPQERVAWVQEHLSSAPLNSQPSGLVKLDASPELAFLPEELVLDSTGNLEIVMKPVSTLEQWEAQVKAINERFGTGSMQAAVSLPSDAWFGRTTGTEVRAAVQQDLGYLNFINDFDVLQKLESGAVRYSTDPTKPAAQSLQHPFLGPMSKLKQGRLARFLERNALGEYFEPNRLAHLRDREASFKYVGSTSYRPDIAGPDRIVLEIRDAHKNFELLSERLMRSTFYMQAGRKQFAGAAGVQAFDSVADYAKLSERVRSMLESLFPSRVKPGVAYDDENRIAAEVYRNFAYPLRDWNSSLAFIKQTNLAATVAEAQASYVRKLEAAAEDLATGRIGKAEASLRVQGAAAQFSQESHLARAFGKFQEGNIFSDGAWNKYMDLAIREMAPLKDFFPSSVWEGSLEARTARFVNKWRANVRLVDDVRFTYKAGEFTKTRSHKVLVISTQGLSPADASALVKDYTDAMSRGLISFPLGEKGGHLYTRVGNRTVDFYFGTDTSVKAYSFPNGSKRLETVMALSPEEELKLRLYIENSIQNGAATLGRSGYDGVLGETNGTLWDNRPVTSSESHNCTSWLCKAPIGSNSEALHELAGAPRAVDVFRNPGWWTSYLSGAARGERVPLIVFWTPESLSAAEAAVRPGSPLTWDFHLH